MLLVLHDCLSINAPTNPSNSTSEAAHPSEALYDQLQSTLSSVPSSDMLVIMGDFNARVGSLTALPGAQSWVLMALENTMKMANGY